MQMKFAKQMAGRLGDELHAIPIFLRELARCVDRSACAGSVMSVPIDLPNFISDREEFLRIGDAFEPAGGPAANGFVIAIRDWHVPAGVIVGGRTKDNIVLSDAKHQAVVLTASKEFD